MHFSSVVDWCHLLNFRLSSLISPFEEYIKLLTKPRKTIMNQFEFYLQGRGNTVLTKC